MDQFIALAVRIVCCYAICYTIQAWHCFLLFLYLLHNYCFRHISWGWYVKDCATISDIVFCLNQLLEIFLRFVTFQLLPAVFFKRLPRLWVFGEHCGRGSRSHRWTREEDYGSSCRGHGTRPSGANLDAWSTMTERAFTEHSKSRQSFEKDCW